MARTKTKMRTRTVAILVGIGVAVAGGGIAFAYFTNVGAGSGTAGTGSNNPVVVKQTSDMVPMGPGANPQLLSGNFDNNQNPGPVFIASVTATVSSVALPSVAPTPSPSPGLTCGVTDFVIGNGIALGTTQTATTTTGLGVEVPAGSAKGNWSGLNLQFNNKSTVNQDACKNSTVTITYTAK